MLRNLCLKRILLFFIFVVVLVFVIEIFYTYRKRGSKPIIRHRRLPIDEVNEENEFTFKFDSSMKIWESDIPGKKYFLGELPEKYENIEYIHGKSCSPIYERKCWRKPLSEETSEFFFKKLFSSPYGAEWEYEYKPNPELVEKYIHDYPYLTGHTILASCDHVIENRDYPFETVRNGDFIAVIEDSFFWDYVLEKLKNVKIIVYLPPIGDRCNICKNMDKLTNSKNLIAVFTHSFDVLYHPKLVPMFYGFSYSRKHNTLGEISAFEATGTDWKRKKDDSYLVFSSFAVETNPRERKYCYDTLKPKPFVSIHGTYGSRAMSLNDFVQKMGRSKFVACPSGNGMNTIRLSQTLMVGSFPIVRSSPMNILFEGLPVLIVEKWEDVTEELLNKKYEEFRNFNKKEYDLSKLYAEYYLRLVRNCKERIMLGLL